MRTRVFIAPAFAVATLGACSEAPELGAAPDAIHSGEPSGQTLFDNPLPRTNGRSCATCHVEADHTTLLPATVLARLDADPLDPLFNRLDADDPEASVSTYEHLKAGLVRVTLPLPDNVDVIDASGQVVTNAARTISVWRAVPTVENTALTAPYQLDGRNATLEEQALGALRAHSDITGKPPTPHLRRIADRERTMFSSPAVAAIAEALAEGAPPPDPDPPLTDAETRGKALFQQACAPCHGGPSGTEIQSPGAVRPLHPVIAPDGSVALTSLPDGSPFPAAVRTDQDGNRFLNIGIAFGTYLGQLGAFPNFTGVDFPQYRLRFYTNKHRKHKVVDLPPPAFDPVTGDAIFGPNLAPQAWSVDPGRALVTGDPADFEAFDAPTLYGIANTPPYFHDNSAPDLATVIDIYSRFILAQLPVLGLPRVVPPPPDLPLPPESLDAGQKADLIAYLQRI